MREPGNDIRQEILERVFPALRYGGDPDIERYFELRRSGRMLDALSVYMSRLKPRYPDDRQRVTLLGLYRTRSPAYTDYLSSLLYARADAIIVAIKAAIDKLTAPLAGVRLKDTYAVLKAVERVARLLPDDADAARNAAGLYEEYARILDYRKREMGDVSYLLSEFYDQAALGSDDAPDFVTESWKAEEERRIREAERERKNFFDLSKIEFDEEDVRRIEIPPAIGRDEDRVLAYCHKYWLLVEDPAFERVVWLYSRKYGTKHYDVYRAIKMGRRRKYADDEILTLVATTIAERYSYTVRGDLYMQAAWRRVKAALCGQAPAPVAVQSGRERASARTSRQVADPRSQVARKPSSPASAEGPAAPQDTPVDSRRRPAPAPFGASRQTPEPAGSISDRIRVLSGRAYDVYRDIFLEQVRGHIRDALVSPRRSSAFGDALNRAEALVHDFMERNYANPYMNWADSEHRERLSTLGYDLPELEGIIDACYRKISA